MKALGLPDSPYSSLSLSTSRKPQYMASSILVSQAVLSASRMGGSLSKCSRKNITTFGSEVILMYGEARRANTAKAKRSPSQRITPTNVFSHAMDLCHRSGLTSTTLDEAEPS